MYSMYEYSTYIQKIQTIVHNETYPKQGAKRVQIAHAHT